MFQLMLAALLSPCALISQCEFTCISQVNLSLDQNCQATVSAETVLSNYSNTALADFNLILKDEAGVTISGTTIDESYLGQNLTYELLNNLSGCNLSCWGRVKVEYKFLPVIDCPDDLTLSCGALDVLPLPNVTGGSNCVDTAFDIYLANEERTKLECDPDFTFIVTRTYEATDGAGNTASCVQTLHLNRPDLSNIHFPSGTTCISCSDTDNYLFYDNDGESIPLPWVTTTGSGTGSGTYAGFVDNPGVPFVCEPSGIFTTSGFCVTTGSGTGSGTPLIPSGGASIYTDNGPELIDGSTTIICNSVVQYTDMVVPTDDCKTKVFRTWEIREWWCSGEYLIGPSTQLIEIKDDVAPEFVCPADLTITTDDDCGGMVNIPAITATDGCGHGVNVKIFHPNGSIDGNGGLGILDPGDNVINYVVSDDCYNSASCDMTITIRDLTEPVAICEQTTVVSLTDSGLAVAYASTFDNGSWDECGISDMQVRRMTSDCDPSDLNFGPYVTFCCSDVGTDVMVVFRAFDLGGNHSDCMVNVEVQDKTLPQIACPKDLTVDCKTVYALDNLALTFGEAVITDNCAHSYTSSEQTSGGVNQCGIGEIIRTLAVLAPDGTEMASCKQQLTFADQTPFMASEIVWPTSYVFNDSGRCSVSDLTPVGLNAPFNYPSFPTQDDHCSLLGFDYEDVVTGEGGCIKITRKWRVIDWCTQVNGQFLVYENPTDQVIEIRSTKIPVITLSQNPITFSSNSIDCVNTNVTVSASSNNTCSAGLLWTYIIRDLGGNIMTSGNGNTFSGPLPASNYTIEWGVTTACGNIGTATQNLIVENTKAPIPVCMSAMEVQLTNQSGLLHPHMINVGSYSPCNNPVRIGFTATDLVQTPKSYTCADLGTSTQNLWVTDVVTGNQDFCTTQITVTDSDNMCPPISQLVITGEVYTESYESVEDVGMTLATSMPMVMTDVEGSYAFPSMPHGGSYELVPEKDVDYLNGVSTLDLILIQRHILGLEQLTSPYQLIAADINDSEEINGLDLVELRKLILGIYTELPHNTSWRFVDEAYEFSNEENPWEEDISESYEIETLSSDMDIDFIGVKVGDVNGSAITSSVNEEIDFRSQRWPVQLELVSAELSEGASTRVSVTAHNYERVSGWQGTLEFDPTKVLVYGVQSLHSDIVQSSFDLSHVADGYLTFSIAHKELTDIVSGSELFSLELISNVTQNTKDLFALSSRVTKAEAYRGYSELVDLELSSQSSLSNKILAAIPNPWIERTSIQFEINKPGQARWEFYDASGKLLYHYEDVYQKGQHYFSFDGSDLDIQGVIYIRLISSDDVAEFKTLRI